MRERAAAGTMSTDCNASAALECSPVRSTNHCQKVNAGYKSDGSGAHEHLVCCADDDGKFGAPVIRVPDRA